MKRVVIAAMECEAEALRPALKPGDALVVCGVGKVNAALAAQCAIDEGADEILNGGVAGGLDGKMSVGDVFEVDRAVEYDFDLSDVNGTAPGVLDERNTPYFACRTTGRFPARTLATGDHFRDDAGRDLALFKHLGCTLRDMEGAAIAHVCDRAGVPFRALKSVSNVLGQGSMTGQYARHRAEALRTLGEAARAWL